MAELGEIHKGDKVGEAGATGATDVNERSNGVHLHFEVRFNENGQSSSNPLTVPPQDPGKFHNWPATGVFNLLTDGWQSWLSDFMERFRDLFRAGMTNGSPLILDLDGDGIETSGVKDGAWFDHKGDGFAEQTGWVGKDDGLLVMDRNGNGRIEAGSELFGDSTPTNLALPNGTKASAANGF